MITKADISFIQPSRNNLKYLKWSYDAIRKNGGSEPHICVADDFSNDGTWEWCQEMMSTDPNFHAIRNEGPTRLGHTILYDRLINEVAPTKIVGIYHADMWLCPGALESVLEHIKPMTVVSLTRIEPDLHPAGPEKVLINNAPTETEDFTEDWFLQFFNNYLPSVKDKTTEGIFAPWFLFKEDFQSIGGHDPLYAPQSKEDSDIFNRFLLNDYQFVQTWEGCVFHLTCRGSRFNPTLTTPGQNSNEWEAQNIRSTRNFIRKWGHFVKHDAYMKPIIPHKYGVGFLVHNCSFELLQSLEPWCDNIYVENEEIIRKYIEIESNNTQFNLYKRIGVIGKNDPICENDIVVEFDGRMLNQNNFIFIERLSEILTENEITVGYYEIDIFKFHISAINHYESELIKIKR